MDAYQLVCNVQIFQWNFSALRAVFQSNIPVRFFRIKKFPEPCFSMIFARRRRKFWKTGSSIRHFYCFLPCKKWNFVSNYNFLSEIQSFCSFPVIFSRGFAPEFQSPIFGASRRIPVRFQNPVSSISKKNPVVTGFIPVKKNTGGGVVLRLWSEKPSPVRSKHVFAGMPSLCQNTVETTF